MIKVILATALIGAGTASAMAVELPPEIAKQGSIKVAIVPNYPPMEFRDPATNALTGFDVELGEALGRKLGVKIAWQETSFDQMMPAIATGRVDAILSGMTDLASRQDTATFVDYLRNGPRFFAQQSRAAEFKDMTAVCGKRVGASRRTSFPKHIAAWSDAHCGGDAIQFVGTEGSADARTQLKQGRLDAAVQGGETRGPIPKNVHCAIRANYRSRTLPVEHVAHDQFRIAKSLAPVARMSNSDGGLDVSAIARIEDEPRPGYVHAIAEGARSI